MTLSQNQNRELAVTVEIQPADSAGGIAQDKPEGKYAGKDKAGVECASARHIGTRAYQQDTVETGRSLDGAYFGILCDGMGGLDAGGLASNEAAKKLTEALCGVDRIDDIPGFLVAQAHSINHAIHTMPSGDGTYGAMGTTLAAAVIAGNSLYWLSVGDSRVYIVRGQEIVRATHDHNYALELDEQVRAGLLSEEEAAADAKRDALISFLGMEELRLIDYNPIAFALEPGDMVLLCSDGLYRTLNDEDILQVITMHAGDLEECARVLPLYAFDRAEGSHDNTSVVLLRYQNGKPV